MSTIVKENKVWRVRIRRKGSLPISKQFKSKVDATKWARRVERLVELGKYEDISEAGMTFQSIDLIPIINIYIVKK
tara:strand:- start:346 stop:573 length:228 start_codon:yes stop_codon:yes gene_type:complete